MKAAVGEKGMDEDQANAMCYAAWRGKAKESVSESLPQPRVSTGPAVIEPGAPREKQYEFIARCIKEVKDRNSTIADDEASAMCFTAWNSRYESVHPADAMISEASTSDWSKVDKSRLPMECFLWVDDPSKRETWRLPVYEGAGGIDPKNGLFRERGEINLNALRLAQGQKKAPASVRARVAFLLRQFSEQRYEVYHAPDLQEGSSESRLIEAMKFDGAEFIEEDGKRIVKNVAMLGQVSSHGYEYKQEGMAKAVKGGLYEGVRIFINHTDPGQKRDLMHLAGVFRNPRHEDGKVRGDAHLLDDAYGRKFWDIAKTMPEAAGCSHVADGKLVRGQDGKQYVEEITKVHSVDLVVQGATTRNVFEGETPPEDKSMDVKDMKAEDLKTARPEIARTLIHEGAASRDEEVQALIREKQEMATKNQALVAEKEALTKSVASITEEKKQLQAKVDEMQVQEATRQKEAVVTKALSDLPEQARTQTFKDICMSVTTGTNGFDMKIFEAKIADLVKDRKTLCEQTGVRGMGGEQHRSTTVSEAEADKALTL